MPDPGTILFCLGTGLAAGVVGGMLGLGGGIILMPVLRFVFGLSLPYAAGTTIMAVFFTAAAGSARHHAIGNINLPAIRPILLSGAAATLLFSLLFTVLAEHERWLDLGVGVVFSTVAIRMIFEGLARPAFFRTVEERKPDVGDLYRKIGIGATAGVLPGLLGIGTGAILVPAFRYLLRWPVREAMGSSLACFAVNALISTYFKWAQGYVDIGFALPICLGALLGAYAGAELNRRLSSRTLHLAFGLIFVYVSTKFIFTSFGIQV